MEGYLRKYGWVLQLLFVILVAILLAFIASKVTGYYLAPYRVPDVELAAKTPTNNLAPIEQKTSPDVMARVINERCLFEGCPEKEGPRECNPPCSLAEVCSDGVCVPDESIQTETVGDVPVESSSGMKLLGVIVARNPAHSSAMIKLPSEPVSSFVRVGSRVGSFEIKEIYRDRIIFTNNTALEFVRLDNSLQGNPSRTRQPSNPPSVTRRPTPGNVPSRPEGRVDEPKVANRRTGGLAAPGSASNIKKAAPKNSSAIEISRGDINRALSDPATLAKDLKFAPHYQNGQPSGVRMMSVGGVFDKIGLKNGDVVKKINGQPVNSQTGALKVLLDLKNARSVGIEIDRRGKTETVNYSIK